jgi:hypothetical protein
MTSLEHDELLAKDHVLEKSLTRTQKANQRSEAESKENIAESYNRTLVETTAAMSLIPKSVGVLANHTSAATVLFAMAIGCAANWLRNRTFHCGITGPLFLITAMVFLLSDATMIHVSSFLVWPFVLIGVGVAFLLEWRQLPISPDCVSDASLVAETCPNRFVDSRELTNNSNAVVLCAKGRHQNVRGEWV